MGELTSLAIIKLEVLHRVLLIPHRRTRSTAIKRQIRQQPTTTFLDEKSHMNNIRSSRHIKHDVLQTSRLGGRPVHARGGRSGRDIRRVDDEVADLSEEYVYRFPV